MGSWRKTRNDLVILFFIVGEYVITMTKRSVGKKSRIVGRCGRGFLPPVKRDGEMMQVSGL